MFSKTDFTDYIDQITHIETKMISNIDVLFSHIQEGNLRALLDKIREDEQKHISILTEITDIIKQQPEE